MKSYEFDAIGTHWAIELLEGHLFNDRLITRIHHTVELFDRQYSRFRDDSLIAQLARTGELIDPPAEMVDMFAFAREMYEVSNGAFTIAVGATLHRMGYGKRIHGREIDRNIWDKIGVSPKRIVIPKGEMLDFGGFGKGWLIDNIVSILRDTGMPEFIVNGGGDVYCQSDRQIEFKLEDPYDETMQLGQTRITNGALAASNTIKRSWLDGDARKHHIIDPGVDDSSSTDIIATYVRADTALVADTMATILILRPEMEAELVMRYGLKTILIRK